MTGMEILIKQGNKVYAGKHRHTGYRIVDFLLKHEHDIFNIPAPDLFATFCSEEKLPKNPTIELDANQTVTPITDPHWWDEMQKFLVDKVGENHLYNCCYGDYSILVDYDRHELVTYGYKAEENNSFTPFYTPARELLDQKKAEIAQCDKLHQEFLESPHLAHYLTTLFPADERSKPLADALGTTPDQLTTALKANRGQARGALAAGLLIAAFPEDHLRKAIDVFEKQENPKWEDEIPPEELAQFSPEDLKEMAETPYPKVSEGYRGEELVNYHMHNLTGLQLIPQPTKDEAIAIDTASINNGKQPKLYKTDQGTFTEDEFNERIHAGLPFSIGVGDSPNPFTESEAPGE